MNERFFYQIYNLLFDFYWIVPSSLRLRILIFQARIFVFHLFQHFLALFNDLFAMINLLFHFMMILFCNIHVLSIMFEFILLIHITMNRCFHSKFLISFLRNITSRLMTHMFETTFWFSIEINVDSSIIL